MTGGGLSGGVFGGCSGWLPREASSRVAVSWDSGLNGMSLGRTKDTSGEVGGRSEWGGVRPLPNPSFLAITSSIWRTWRVSSWVGCSPLSSLD